MKKTMIILGAVFISLLLISSATAVPQTHSKPAMNMIEKIEQKTTVVEALKQKSNTLDPEGKNCIDWIIQLLRSILNVIYQLIQLVLDLFQIIQILEAIIAAIYQLVDLIIQFINTIIDLFTPDVHY